jgi:hypothetical protein
MTPTIVATATGAKPSFELLAIASVLPIPAASWNSSLAEVGSTIENLNSQPWFPKVPEGLSGNLSEVVNSEISPDSLLVVLNNTGHSPVTISSLNVLVNGPSSSANAFGSSVTVATIMTTKTTVTTVTEITTLTGSSNSSSLAGMALATGSASVHAANCSDEIGYLQRVPKSEGGQSIAQQASVGSSTPSSETVATFLVLADGSIIQPRPSEAPIPSSMIGLTIQPGHETVLLFLGQISTLPSPVPPHKQQGIIGGQQYVIQVVSPLGATAEFGVTASYPNF